MFTGIVEEIGTVSALEKGGASVRLTVACQKAAENARRGDSISVNGICLTVADCGPGWFSADVMPETVRRSGLAGLTRGGRVNLERALRPADRMGGHIVSGHIDGIGTVLKREDEGNAVWLTIGAPDKLLRYVVEKGSVALDGTSLTVAYVDDACLKVSLIPTTLSDTVLGERKPGDIVNIECDIIGKYVEKLMGAYGAQPEKRDISMEFLRENGFL